MVTLRLLFLASLALLSTPIWALSKVELSVDINPVYVNQGFTLQISADDSLDSDAFDSSFLLKQGFIVGGSSVSRQVQIINGDTQSLTTWSTKLRARKSGQHHIPSIEINGIKSNSISIDVLDSNQQPSTPANKTSAIQLLTSLSKHEAISGEVLFYKVELYLGADLARGANLSEPEVEGASISKLGEQQQEVKIINGKRVVVITVNYSLRTQNPGSFRISGPSLDGKMVIPNGSGFYARNSLEPIFITGQDQEFTVKALPSGLDKDILVSPFVSLTQTWQPELNDNNEIKVGEAITRTITLVAAQQKKEQLPELKPEYPLGIRHYADEISRDESVQGKQLFANLIHKEAIIATKEGHLSIPELSVPWFNSQSQQLEYATLPAQSFKVVASEQASSVTSTEQDCPPATILNNNGPINQVPNNGSSLWLWSTLALAIAWLITLLLLITKKQTRSKAVKVQKQQLSDKELKQAIKALHPISAEKDRYFRQQLLLWAQGTWPQKNIVQIADIPAYDELKTYLKQIDAQLWANTENKAEQGIDIKGLIKAIDEIKNTANAQSSEQSLNPR